MHNYIPDTLSESAEVFIRGIVSWDVAYVADTITCPGIAAEAAHGCANFLVALVAQAVGHPRWVTLALVAQALQKSGQVAVTAHVPRVSRSYF